MMKNSFIIILISFIGITSCDNNKNNELDHYRSGNLKSQKFYDSTGDLKELREYYDLKDTLIYRRVLKQKGFDSIFIFYKNGNLYQEGKLKDDSLRFGIWNRYTRKGRLSDIKEYFIIDDKSILNRKFFLNKGGDTIWYASKFNQYAQDEFVNDTLKYRNSIMVHFDIYSKDTITLSEPFAAAVRCNSPFFRNYNSEIVMYLATEDQNFNERFSNISDVKLDTFRNLNYDKVNRENFPNANPNYVAVFGRWFDKPGEKILRGYMEESFNRTPTSSDSIIGAKRKVYFDKRIFVKDTLQNLTH